MLGLFKINRNKKVSVKLQLLQLMKICNVFYANLLQKASTNSLTNKFNELTPLFIFNN